MSVGFDFDALCALGMIQNLRMLGINGSAMRRSVHSARSSSKVSGATSEHCGSTTTGPKASQSLFGLPNTYVCDKARPKPYNEIGNVH